MAKLQVIDAVQADNLVSLQELIATGADVNEQDEQGWTALCWAAGKGNPAMVKLLIDSGADVFKVGRDQRTPYAIALAAGHVEVLELLQQAEARVDGNRSPGKPLKYCRAFPVSKLSQFEGWTTGEDSDGVLFLHHDYSVTESMWHNENVVFDQVTSEWKEFCANELDFGVPNEIELVRANQ